MQLMSLPPLKRYAILVDLSIHLMQLLALQSMHLHFLNVHQSNVTNRKSARLDVS